MAVVTRAFTVRGPVAQTARQHPSAAMHPVIIDATIEIGSADSATSTYSVGFFPSRARLHGVSWYRLDDLASTGSPTLDFGVRGLSGATADPDAINDGIDAGTAAQSGLIKDPANYGKTLWELSGLSADPGGPCEIYMSLVDADVNAGGTVSVSIAYSVD